MIVFGPNFQFDKAVPTHDSGSMWALLLLGVNGCVCGSGTGDSAVCSEFGHVMATQKRLPG
jgi:hypothetical protein